MPRASRLKLSSNFTWKCSPITNTTGKKKGNDPIFLLLQSGEGNKLVQGDATHTRLGDAGHNRPRIQSKIMWIWSHGFMIRWTGAFSYQVTQSQLLMKRVINVAYHYRWCRAGTLKAQLHFLSKFFFGKFPSSKWISREWRHLSPWLIKDWHYTI